MKHTHPASPIGRSVHCEPSKTTTKACCGATSLPHSGASSVMLVAAVWNSPMVAAVATPVPVGAAVARRRRGTGEAAPSNRMPATGADPRRLRREEASASPNASATLAPLVEVGRVPWFASCGEAGVGEEGETSHSQQERVESTPHLHFYMQRSAAVRVLLRSDVHVGKGGLHQGASRPGCHRDHVADLQGNGLVEALARVEAVHVTAVIGWANLCVCVCDGDKVEVGVKTWVGAEDGTVHTSGE